jgi:hypothetical protein
MLSKKSYGDPLLCVKPRTRPPVAAVGASKDLLNLLELGRRWLLSLAFASAATLWGREIDAQAIDVPIRLQAELLSKVAAYDREFSNRAGQRALVLVVVKPGSAESERAAEQMSAELAVLSDIGGLPHAQETVRYTSAPALGELVRGRTPAVVIFSAALDDQVESVARVLDGVSVLSVGVSAAYVPRGAVLGFDVESGKPKLVVNLGQARRQRVAFRPELLRLARVIQ